MDRTRFAQRWSRRARRLSGLAVVWLLCAGVPGAAAAREAGASRFVTEVRPGQTLSAILDAQGYAPATLLSMLKAGADAWRLERLQPGQRVELERGDDGALHELVLQVDAEEAYRFTRVGDAFEVRRETIALDRRTASAAGTVQTSLYDAARSAGLSNRVILELAGVFEWDLDLRLDLRVGDRFSVVYEELYLGGEKVRDGAILAAELVSRGRALRALRYQDPTGRVAYYTPDGTGLQKAFLRSPVEFARVSSGFSQGRRHPVLHTLRAHQGVDYAAPTGTPIRATGEGTVRLAGAWGEFGNTVVLEHGGQHATLYAHMSRFARGLHAGSRVRQGEVIGYIGASGLATGPHVHYEFQVRGVHQDPSTVDLPSGDPVPDRYRADFIAKTRRLSARLGRVSELRLANAD